MKEVKGNLNRVDWPFCRIRRDTFLNEVRAFYRCGVLHQRREAAVEEASWDQVPLTMHFVNRCIYPGYHMYTVIDSVVYDISGRYLLATTGYR